VSSAATRRIALSGPWIDERDEELVLEVLRSGQLSLGPTGPRFEELLADAVGAPYCAAVSSGTTGLHLCMKLAGVGPGDEVITSPYSFVASANCAIYEGATPVFADVDPATLNLDPDAVEAAVTPRTKAIVAVDIFGYPCALDELLAVCERHGLAFVEDSCEALGARYKGRPLGSHGHPATFAFYPNKQMTTGEGGAVTTGSAEEHELLLSLRNQGRLETSSWLQHGRLGFNYRLDDLSAALGIGQLEKLDRLLEARREVAARYEELLTGVDVETPLPDDADHVRSWFVYVVKLPRGVDRDGVLGRLAAEGVAGAPYLPSIHLQPYMRERYGFSEGLCPVSEDASARTTAIPFHGRLPREDQERVVEALRAALEAS
jgi:dTDP-4-amino-4,6-dideoxygalactose transaminase